VTGDVAEIHASYCHFNS